MNSFVLAFLCCIVASNTQVDAFISFWTLRKVSVRRRRRCLFFHETFVVPCVSISCLFFLTPFQKPSPKPSPIPPPKPSPSTCANPISVHDGGDELVIDGRAEDWQFSPSGPMPLNESNEYFLANMYYDGKRGKSQLSRAYGSFDCDRKIFHVLVHVAGCSANKIDKYRSKHWLKIHDISSNVVPPLQFELIYQQGVPKGWEASYDFSSYSVIGNGTCFSNVEIHAYTDKKSSLTENAEKGSGSRVSLNFHCSPAQSNISPSAAPSVSPSAAPHVSTGATPSVSPNAAPNVSTSAAPSVFTSATPSVSPNAAPSVSPSAAPSPAEPISTSLAPTSNNNTLTSCDNYCQGSYPYGCADALNWPWKYMCEPSGGCHYTYIENSTGPYDDNSIWCTYKTQTPTGPRDP